MITGTTPFTTVIAEPSCLRYSTFNLFWNYLINWLLRTCLIYQAFTFALSVSALFLLCTFQGPIFLISSIKACSSRHLAYGFAKHVADLLNVIRFLCYCHFILSLVNVLWIFSLTIQLWPQRFSSKQLDWQAVIHLVQKILFYSCSFNPSAKCWPVGNAERCQAPLLRNQPQKGQAPSALVYPPPSMPEQFRTTLAGLIQANSRVNL